VAAETEKIEVLEAVTDARATHDRATICVVRTFEGHRDSIIFVACVLGRLSPEGFGSCQFNSNK
jgi:hypothetical protein